MGIPNPLEIYEHVETCARREIIRNGGCISHHHGIGKLRKKFVPDTMNDMSQKMLKEMKKIVDPNNIFAINNTVNYDY